MDWWTPQMAGWIGGVLGSVVGLLGASVGAAAGILLPKGKGKRLVLGLAFGIIGLGVACLGVGLAALLLGQPRHVWYPMLLIGFVGTLVAGINTPVLMARYRQAEARRLDAEQLRRG